MPYARLPDPRDDLVRDDEAASRPPQRDSAIDRAVQRYSTDRPRMKVVDVAAAGGNVLALPAGWEADFSELISVEYPIGRTRRVPRARALSPLPKTDGTQELRFDDALPVGKVRLEFTIKQSSSPAARRGHRPARRSRGGVQVGRGGPLRPARALYSNTPGLDDPGGRRAVPEQGRRAPAPGCGYRKQYLDAPGHRRQEGRPRPASS
jgi:hypothetical protein